MRAFDIHGASVRCKLKFERQEAEHLLAANHNIHVCVLRECKLGFRTLPVSLEPVSIDDYGYNGSCENARWG